MLNWVKRIQEEDQFNITFISIGPTAGIKESPELSAVLHTSTSHTFNIQTRARYWWDFRSGANVESTVAANSLVHFQPHACQGLCAHSTPPLHDDSCLFRCRLTWDLNSGLQKTLKAFS